MTTGRTPQNRPTRRTALLLALACVVHGVSARNTVVAQAKQGGARPARSTPAPAVIMGKGAEGLPPAVADMRAAIVSAVETGDIAELKEAMDLNELKPEFGGPPGVDPIQYLRTLSADGTGKDVLAALAVLLDAGWAAIPGGRDVENNRIYVWPHFAEVPLERLSSEETAALSALAGGEPAKAMIAARRYRGWRLSIGADGVWHMFAQVKG